jgi:hypothetical protein
VANLVWEANTVSAAGHRTVDELLADSDALARETILDATLEQAPVMVRSWDQRSGLPPTCGRCYLTSRAIPWDRTRWNSFE